MFYIYYKKEINCEHYCNDIFLVNEFYGSLADKFLKKEMSKTRKERERLTRTFYYFLFLLFYAYCQLTQNTNLEKTFC